MVAQNTYMMADVIQQKVMREQESQVRLGKKFNKYNPKVIVRQATISEYFEAVKSYNRG